MRGPAAGVGREGDELLQRCRGKPERYPERGREDARPLLRDPRPIVADGVCTGKAVVSVGLDERLREVEERAGLFGLKLAVAAAAPFTNHGFRQIPRVLFPS